MKLNNVHFLGHDATRKIALLLKCHGEEHPGGHTDNVNVVDMPTRYTTTGPNSDKLTWPTDGGETYGPAGRPSCWRTKMEESSPERSSRIWPMVDVGQILDVHGKIT
jgi:hypothetical protein